jgi:hypothetical protein
MLGGMRGALDDAGGQAVDHFNAAKGRLDAAGEGADQVCVNRLSLDCSGTAVHDGTSYRIVALGVLEDWGSPLAAFFPGFVRKGCRLPMVCVAGCHATALPPLPYPGALPCSQCQQNAVIEVLHATTSVRALLAAGLASGLRNDAPDRALAMRQK